MSMFTGQLKGRLGSFAAGAIATASLLSASAPAVADGFYQSYQINAPVDVTSIVIYQKNADGGGGTTNSFTAFAPSTLITDPFLKLQPITGTYFLGVASFAGQSEEEASNHLILAFNNSFAGSVLRSGEDFADLFSGYDESSLIGALQTLSSGDATQLAIDNASDLIFNFSDTVTAAGGLFGPTSRFTMVAFSTASDFGDGETALIPGAPEPAAWALMILGFGGTGAALRRRRRASALA